MFAKIGIAILVLALADLLFLNWVVIKNQNQESAITNNGSERNIENLASPSPTPSLSTTASATLKTNPPASPETKTIVEKDTPPSSGQAQTIVQTAQKEIFVPIGSGSTKNNSYTDLSGLEITIDTSKYSTIDSVVFEGSVWVQDGNGKAYAQLYNKSDGSPVWSSEITSLASTGTLKTSPKINLATGNKTYVVQAKTDLVEYAAHVENARIKIILK